MNTQYTEPRRAARSFRGEQHSAEIDRHKKKLWFPIPLRSVGRPRPGVTLELEKALRWWTLKRTLEGGGSPPGRGCGTLSGTRWPPPLWSSGSEPSCGLF